MITITNNITSNRYGFNHISRVYDNNYKLLGSSKIHYINRTWESYQYRTSMRAAVSAAMESIANKYINTFKQDHNYKNMTKKRIIEFSNYLLETDSLYKELNEKYNQL